MARTLLALRRTAGWADLLFVNGLDLEGAIASAVSGKPMVAKVVSDHAWERATNRQWFNGSVMGYQNLNGNLRLRALNWITRKPLNRARTLIVPSVYLHNIVQSWGLRAPNVEVIYNAVESVSQAGTRTYPEYSGRVGILMVGRLIPLKGVRAVIESMTAEPSWDLTVVGEGDERNSLEARVAELSLDDRVSFAGSLSNPEVRDRMRQADVLLLNSSIEGLPNVVLEAMESGLAVVCTAVGGTPELVSHLQNGLLYEAGDTEAMRNCINRLRDDPGLRSRVSENARETIRTRFSFDRMILDLEAVLTAAASDHGTRVLTGST